MRACFRSYDDGLFDVTDAFTPWREVIEWLDEEIAEAVLIWSGGNVSEATFLAMACWWLGGRLERILRVAMPERTGRYHVATQTPAELADLFASRRGLTDIERVDLAEDFVRIRGETGLLRRCDYFSVPSVAPETPLKAQ